MGKILDNVVKKYGSISMAPGSTGTFYYNKFFKKYNINAEYKAFSATLENFNDVLDNLIECQYLGISISMPFKKKVIDYLQTKNAHLTQDVLLYNSCNTVFIEKNKLLGYNSDLSGVKYIEKQIRGSVSILGNGAIGQMFYQRFKDNFSTKIYSRSLNNWQDRHEPRTIIVNCTPLGTISDESPIDYIPKTTETIIDLAIKPSRLAQLAKNIKYIPGIIFYKYQFITQFKVYTGFEIKQNEFE